MKKGIEWLKDRILRSKGTCIFMRDNSEPHGGGRRFYSGMLTSIDLILGFIDQLDEPEIEQVRELESYVDDLIRYTDQLKNELRGGKVMKKDIECLQSMIQRRIDNLPTGYEGLYIEGSRDAYELVLQDIDQLDEPEVLSQEWIDKNKTSIDRKLDGTPIYKVREDLLQNLLVPKQEITFDQVHDKLREESILSEKSFDYYWNCINDNVEIDEPGNLIVPKQEELESKIKVLIEAYKQEDGAYSNPENGWISGFVEDLENLVEEEPKYYAMVKGHELMDSSLKYWTYHKHNKSLYLGYFHSSMGDRASRFTKLEWIKLGINDSNADFIELDIYPC